MLFVFMLCLILLTYSLFISCIDGKYISNMVVCSREKLHHIYKRIILYYYVLFIIITHSAFNLLVFPNYLFTLFFALLMKGYVLSGEIALKNNHYYYYFRI